MLPAFDPRIVPLDEGDFPRLPALPASLLSAQALRTRFAQALQWEPEHRSDSRWLSDRSPTPASVLVPLVLRPEPTVLLTVRGGHLSDHAGQISFPGGKSDDDDADAVETALREAEEEIGLHRQQVEVLGVLPVYTTSTRFEVSPVVGLVTPLPQDDWLIWEQGEVDEVFEVPLAFLMNPANHRRHGADWGGQRRHFLSMPWVDASQHKSYFIWGATAAMLRNLYRFLAATESSAASTS